MAEISKNLWKEYNGKGFAAQYATYAARATSDENGYAINATYATKSEVNGKQDTISDLSSIRSGAAAGASAIQPDDVFSTLSNGLVPAASGTGDTDKYLKGDGTWGSPSSIPSASDDSVWSHLNGSDLWAPVTFGDYELPYSLSPDIPDAYKNLYQQVEYIWSNDGGLINVNGLSFKSTDKFVVNIYVKDLQDRACDLVAASESQNLSGDHGFELDIDPAYYPGQCSYWISFGSGRTQKVINYKSGTTNPTLEELPRRQKIVAHAPYLIMNETTLLDNVPSTLKNLTSIRYVGIDSGLARIFAFGIMEVRDDNDNIIVKLVPCLNKSTGKYGVFCVQTSQFCGASDGTIQEFVAP